MTERFMTDDCGTLIDMHTRDTFDYVSDVCNLLNELSEKNERLKEYNNKLMKQPLLFDVQTIPNTMEIIEANTQLSEENEHIKQTIKDMMETERTELGRSVLRQLWEAIQ